MLKDCLGILKVGLRAGKFLVLVLSVYFFCFVGNVKAATNADTMAGYWKFNGDALDASGHLNHGTIIGGSSYSGNTPSTITFSDPSSINFSGTSNYMSIATSSTLQPTSQMTFAFWVYFTTIPGIPTTIGGNYFNGNPNFGFFFQASASNISFNSGNGTSPFNTSSSSNLSVGVWRHIAATCDTSTGISKIYINGVQDGTGVCPSVINYSGTLFQVGRFSGQMDDVRLYQRVLTDSEISALAAGSYTSASWQGDVDSNYDTAANWNPPAVPDPYTRVTIDNVGIPPQFSIYPEEMAGLTINTGASLNILGNNLTLNDSGNFSNNGTFILQNGATQVLTGFINDTNSGTVRINGISDTATLKTGYQYNNLTINSSAYTTALAANLQVNGNLALESGTLDVTAVNHNISVGGDWTNAGGSFLPRNGAVTLNGTNQSIIGANTFYNLTKTVATADTLTFEAGFTQTILNDLTLQGNGATSQFLSLRPYPPATTWTIDPQGAINFSGLDVQYGYITVPVVLPGINHDSGNNNINWVFDTVAPAVSLDAGASHTANNRQPITGTATEAVMTVSSVEFQMETTGGSWTPCVAADGIFDEAAEDFTCTPGSNLADSYHAMYVRAMDANGNTGTGLEVSPASFTVDTTPSNLSEVTPIATPTSNTTPNYTFNADEAGAISYGGGCSAPTINAAIGNNAITFSALAQGTYASCTIRVTDAVGNISSPLLITGFTIDTAPDISSIAESVSSSGAALSWTTDESSSTQVEYGLTTGYGTASTETDIISGVTSHSVSLSGLSSCKTYHYRVISRDATSNEGASIDKTFKTSGCSDSCAYDKPDTPDIDKTEADLNSIRLFINEASGTVDRYELKYGTSSGSYQWSVDDIGGEGTDEFLVEKLSLGTAYYFKIRAINDCEKSDWSDEASGKTDSEPDKQSSVPPASEETTPITTAPAAELPKPNFNESTSRDWQLKYFGSGDCQDTVKCAGSADPDKDGLTNNEEFRLGTDPNVPDSDGDGVIDGQEIETGHDPLKSAGTQEGDAVQYEDPKVSGEVEKEAYKVSNAELVESGGEKKLKISGKAPPNSYVTLFIYSQPVVLTVKTDSNGNWSYILDKNLEDGQHEVYVAVTDSTGKITAKSEPFFFAKTAEAITVIPSAEASALAKAAPPVEKRKNSYMLYFIIIGIVGLAGALALIGYVIKGSGKKEDMGVVAQ